LHISFSRRLRFAKGHGLGNDYIVVDRAELDGAELTPDLVRAICDRHRGVGSDGILVGGPEGAGAFRLRIINPDGTEAEKSGNGLRIFGAWLHGRGLVAMGEWFEVRLPRDAVRLRVEAELGDGVLDIRAEMGRATFVGSAVGLVRGGSSVEHEVLGEGLPLPAGGSADITTVSLGNPHCVVFVDALERDDFLRRAPALCTHAAFTAGTNVQFARVADARERVLEAWIWERGAGETLASGSSACAVACAAVRRGFVEPGRFTVRMPGGEIEVEVSAEFDVKMKGPAVIIFEGELLAAG
jgi:diaminopimelate epimerase